MKSLQTIVILVAIQVVAISVSFGMIYSMEVKEQNSADYVNIAGKNRMYTALTLHELDEFNAGVISEKEIDLIFNEFQDNISLLKNGGMFLGNYISPISDQYSAELQLVEEKFFEFRALADELKDSVENNQNLTESYMLRHEIIEVELLDAANMLTEKLATDFKTASQGKSNLELILPVVNAIIYVITIYIIINILKKENKQIQKLEKLYTIGQMASRLAHDLKNPVTVIKSSLDIIEYKKSSPDELVPLHNKIKKSNEDINRIISDVLEFARTKELHKTKSSVLELFRNSISVIDVPKTVTIDLPKDDVELECDQEKIQGVFVNLIGNSIYAMDNSGTISVKLETSSTNVTIHLTDSGSGIPKDILPHIFEPLFTSKPTGTGLGLGICKNIVEQHKGTISVKNNPTTFTIKLPKS